MAPKHKLLLLLLLPIFLFSHFPIHPAHAVDLELIEQKVTQEVQQRQASQAAESQVAQTQVVEPKAAPTSKVAWQLWNGRVKFHQVDGQWYLAFTFRPS